MTRNLSKLVCCTVQRPGIYQTHSSVIQPIEHFYVNDGLPYVTKTMQTGVKWYMDKHYPKTQVIFKDIEMNEIQTFIENKYKNMQENVSYVLLNHPQPYEFATLSYFYPQSNKHKHKKIT